MKRIYTISDQLQMLLRYCSQCTGWLPLLVIGMAVLMALHFRYQSQLDSDSLALRQLQLERLQLQAANPDSTANAAAKTLTPVDTHAMGQASLEAFLQGLPVSAQLPAILKQISLLAHQHQLALNVGDYQWHLQAGSQAATLPVYEMRFVVRGTYRQSKRFVAEVLSQFPLLALTTFELQRNEVGSEGVDVTLVFAVYLKPEPVHA